VADGDLAIHASRGVIARSRLLRTALSVSLFCLAAVADASAAELRVGLSAETTSLYPNWFVTTGNQQIASHIFDNLVEMDANSIPQPGLAESWSPVDDHTWEFRLRHNVKFHDGTPFTADQVLTTFDQSKTIEGVGASAGAYLRGKTYTKVDDYTVRIATTQPSPLLPNEMTVLYIYPRAAPVEQFNSGAAAIGTGPYKLREWVKGGQIVLERNPDYWGKAPDWDRVIFRVIGAGPTRIAALLNDEVDMINDVPPADISRLKTNPKVNVIMRPGERIMLLTLDSSRDISPFVTDNDGKAYPNPLRDWRVRKAITKAINRDALAERLMDGVAVAAGQIASPGMFGHDPNIKPEPFDPDGAKKLLAEAGYAEGFHLTLHSPNDRYVNDAETAQAIGAMLSRIGIKTEVVAQPWQVFAGQQMGGGERGVPAYSATLYGFGTATGETMSQHWMLLHTPNKQLALGHANVGGYSNLRLDAYLDAAMRTMDADRREKMLWDIDRGYMNDVAVVPLFWQVNAWATRKGLSYEPRIMDVTQAMSVHATK
jgi:peptide/nickel transport system substrate-binding protein